MHKSLLLLGILRGRPMSGYDLHRIVAAHGELYADLKKANVYYLLDRLVAEGCLVVRVEAGAPGPLRERRIFALTDRGHRRFDELLRQVVRTYESVHTGIDVAVVLLGELPRREAAALLAERREVVLGQRARAAGELAAAGGFVAFAADHLLGLMDAELAWLDRTLARIAADGDAGPATHT